MSLSSKVLRLIIVFKAVALNYLLSDCWAFRVCLVEIFFIAQSGRPYSQEREAEVLGIGCWKSRCCNERECVGSRIKTSQVILPKRAISHFFEHVTKAAASAADHSGLVACPGSQM